MNDDLKRQLIISALTTLVVGIVNGILGQINWLWLLFAFVGALGILQLYQAFRKLSSAFDKGRRKGLTFLSVGCLVLVTIAGWNQVVGPLVSDYMVDDASVNLLIRSHRWITYESLQFDPYLFTKPITAFHKFHDYATFLLVARGLPV